MIDNSLLTLVIFTPLAFAVLAALLPAGEKGQSRVVALIGTIVSFGLTLWLYLAFDPSRGAPEFQFETRRAWIESLGISYHIGVDGLAVSLMMLTAVLGPIVMLSTWSAIQDRVKEFNIALLVLQTAMYGTFAALDLALFYVFWETLLVPMYLLIGVWGSENRIYAAVKFFIYTFAASVLMLVAIIYLYLKTGAPDSRSFDYATILNALNDPTSGVQLTAEARRWLFLAFAAAFAVKVPMFPLHTWLPDAHVEAPAAGSIILAGVLLKMGVFGFLRYAMPLFPEAAIYFRPLLAWLAVVGIIYGSLMSFTQKDMKKLVAYSSVAHLGFVMLGVVALTTAASSGAIYQMINHGVSTGALFLLIGIIYERTHTRAIADYGGIAKVVPMFAAAFLVILLSSIGLPGTNGFIGEFMILIGSFVAPLAPSPKFLGGVAAPQINTPVMATLAASGVVLGAVYMLRMYQRVMFGPVRHSENRLLRDLSVREWLCVAPMMGLAVVMGIFPQPFLDRIAPSAERYVQRMTSGPVAVPVMPLANASDTAAAPGIVALDAAAPIAAGERAAAPSLPTMMAPPPTAAPGAPNARGPALVPPGLRLALPRAPLERVLRASPEPQAMPENPANPVGP